MPQRGGALPAHRPGDALALRAHPSRLVAAFREDLERFALENAAQAPRLEAEARGEVYRPPFELGDLRETASSAFGAIVTALEQCALVTVQVKQAQELVRFEATLGFVPGSEIAVALDEQPLAPPSRILELDPELPYHQWSNLRLAQSPLLRRLAAHWAAGQSGLALESAEKLVQDGERIAGIGAAFAGRDVEVMEWPANVSLAHYRTTIRDVHVRARTGDVYASRTYETDVFRTDALAVDRLALSNGTSDPRDALARIESYFGWTGTKLILGASFGDAPEEGLERVSAAASREPAPERALDALSSSMPAELLWLSRTDAATWDRMVQRHVLAEDRFEPLASRPERPVHLVYATAYSGTLEIGGWTDSRQQAAMAARLQSIRHLAQRYFERGHHAGDEAILWYERAARLGHPSGQVAFGWLLETGQGVPRDVARAAHWYRVGGLNGESDGTLELGELFHYGRGGPKDYQQARMWYELSTAQGDSEAPYRVGLLYKDGLGVEKSPKDAFEWFSMAATRGNAASQSELGRAHLYGLGVERNIDEAERWFVRAAEQDYAPAMGMLGDLYKRWKGDDARAVEWFRKGADHDHDYSRYQLARAYEDGTGVEQSASQALELYRTLAEKSGYHQHSAEYRIGALFHWGKLVDPDIEQAASWYRRAAEGDHATAQLALYYLYRGGEGIPEDDVEAIAWLRRAADAQEIGAMAVLGWHLMSGTGVERDQKEAVRLFTAAADEGEPRAQFWLASAYEFGYGVEQDWSEAARWHRAAAEQGHATSQVRLGGQYLAGNGVEKDFVESYAWLTLALESNDEQASALAQGVMMALEPNMTVEQIARGKTLAEERRR